MDKEQIIYEDKDIIVCHKPAGIATQTAKVGQRDMLSEVSNYLGMPVKLVHRLDQPVEGILVFAKNQQAAGELSRQINAGSMEKYYYAVITMDKSLEGDDEITLINYLFKDNRLNASSVVPKGQNGAKRAELCYKIIEMMSVGEFCEEYESMSVNIAGADKKISLTDYEDMDIGLARIKLITGRHHQIRVQMSNAGMSLIGDYKYADKRSAELSELIGQKQTALCAYELNFNHPVTGKRLTFQRKPKGKIFQIFSL